MKQGPYLNTNKSNWFNGININIMHKLNFGLHKSKKLNILGDFITI